MSALFSSIRVFVSCAHCDASAFVPLHTAAETYSFYCENCGQISYLNARDREALMDVAILEYTHSMPGRSTAPPRTHTPRRTALRHALRSGAVLG